jgi:iron(III) transport system permease protein
VLLCLGCLAAEAVVRGRARYARLGSFTRRPVTLRDLGGARWLVLGGFCGLAVVTLGVPVGMVLFWLTQHASQATAPSAASLAALASATATSVGLGLAGAAATVALALPLAYLASRYEGWASRMIERTAYVAQGMPGIVVALALVSLTAQVLQPLYQSAALLVAAYAILFLPLALVSARAALAQVQGRLEEAGRSLGLPWYKVFWRVVLPLAGPGFGAAAALVFVAVVTELTATLLLVPIGTRTLATEMWANSSALAYAAAAPFAAMLVALSLLATWLLARRFGAALRPASG